jgi:hypothetical protein
MLEIMSMWQTHTKNSECIASTEISDCIAFKFKGRNFNRTMHLAGQRNVQIKRAFNQENNIKANKVQDAMETDVLQEML